MPDTQTSDLPAATDVVDADLLVVVDVSDTTASTAGTSKKATATLMRAGLATSASVAEHATSTNNPHGVTKSQVGLANADNTNDAAKPISAASQTALNAKAGIVPISVSGVAYVEPGQSIKAAIAALPQQNGLPVGEVHLRYGDHTVTSAYRVDTGCTLTIGNTTIQNPAAVAGDVGAQVWSLDPATGYILGSSGTLSYVASVVPGTSWTVTKAPSASKTNATVKVSQPGFYLYPGVRITGVGVPGLVNGQQNAPTAPKQFPTQIIDTGNGATIAVNIPPPATNGIEPDGYVLENVCVTGNAANRWGLFGWCYNLLELKHCLFRKHGIWGVALGSPPDAEVGQYFTAYVKLDFVTCQENGLATNTVESGGLYLGDSTWTNLIENSRFQFNYGYNVYNKGAGNVFLNIWNNGAQKSQHRRAGLDLTGTALYEDVRAGRIQPTKLLYHWAEGNTGYECVIDADNVVDAAPLDFEGSNFGIGGGGAAGIYIPAFTNANRVDLRLKACGFGGHAAGWAIDNSANAKIRWEGCNSSDTNGFIKQGNIPNSRASHNSDEVFASTGKPGAVAGARLVGATTGGAPKSGPFEVGDFVITHKGGLWICTVAGTPGTWVATATNPSDSPVYTILDSNPLFYSNSDQFTALADGTAVATASDSSGFSRHLTQATAGKRPVKATIATRPALTFDGIDDRLFTALPIINTGDKILFVTLFNVPTGDFKTIVSFADTIVELRVTPAGLLQAVYNGGILTEPSVSTGVHVWSLRLPLGAPGQLYRDGVLRATGDANVAAYNTTAFSVASQSAAQAANVSVGDIVWTGLLSAADQTSVENILKSKVGL